MAATIDLLEERVNAVSDLVRNLRREVARLEREIAERPGHPSPLAAARGVSPDAQLVEEISRLRAERSVVRERIRALIKEIDQVSW